MKKKKSNIIRNLVRILVLLFLSSIITFILCKIQTHKDNKAIESTVSDAFIYQSMMLANSISNSNSYNDIENLDTEDDSFVSDAAIKTGQSPYYIRVNLEANVVNIYKKDSDGNYTVPYKAMICSTGKATPKTGTYKISYKYRWLRLYGNVYGQYSTRIVKSILFHSVPYFEQRANSLEYEEYDKLGTSASAGCVRLTVEDAKWIYDNITSGTYVEFYSEKNPGPLGKPSAEKISSNTQCRDWDPTDPDKNNPWNGGSGIPSVTYVPPTTTKKTTNKNNTPASNENTSETKKSNTQTESKNNTNSDSKPNSEQKTNPEPKTDPEPTTTPEPKIDSEPKTSPDSKPDPEPTTTPDSKPEPEPENKPAPEPEITPTPTPTPEPKTNPEPTANSTPEPSQSTPDPTPTPEGKT